MLGFQRGWVVRYKDGEVIPEWDFNKPFSQLPRQSEIEAVALVFDQRHWVVAGKQHYFSRKSESILFGVGSVGGRQVESRSIGYWEDGKRVCITVNEATGELKGPYELI